MQDLKKIVVTGPESTGKSTLCTQLASRFHTLCCPEYAREYLLTHGMNYTYDDLLTIAKGQIASEDKYAEEVKKKKEKGKISLLFADTDMYVMKVWCEYVFGKCHSYILDKIAERKYDLYLLCNIDLPWVKDELREYPDLESRQELFSIYKEILINQNVPYSVVSGNYEERLEMAVKSIEEKILI